MKTDTKTCTRCKQEKLIDEFGIDNRRGTAKAVCRLCDSEIHKERYAAHGLTQTQRSSQSKLAGIRYTSAKKRGICFDCGAPCYGKVYCDEHREIRARRETQRRMLTHTLKARVCPACTINNLGYRERLCGNCSSPKGRRFRDYHNEWYKSQRREVFRQYGGAHCACCQESNELFLTIDHIADNGNEHRRSISKDGTGAGVNIYMWLKRHKYPSGFQVLCYNCNCGRYRNGGQCPHKVATAA